MSFSSKYLQFSVIYFNLLLLSDGKLLTSNKEFKSTLNILAIFFNILAVGSDLPVSILDKKFLFIFNVLANSSCDIPLLFLNCFPLPSTYVN